MTNEVNKFIEIINCSLYGSTFSGTNLAELNSLYSLATKNSLCAVAYNGFLGWNAPEEVDSFLNKWKNQSLLSSITQLKKNAALKEVIDLFKKNNINYAVFKGIILSGLYPQDGIRYSGDSDIWVDENDFNMAEELLNSLGYIKDDLNSKDCVFNFAGPSLYIEMHKYLWEDYTGKKIEKIKSLNWTDSNTFVTVQVGKSEYTTLGYTEHLEYMFFHIIKHYVYKGFGIRHLIDVALFVNAYIDKIDIKRFWQDMNDVGYEMFCITSLASCSKYLGMDNRIIQGKVLPSDEFIERFILAAIDSGTFGDPLVRTTELDGFYDDDNRGDTRFVRSLFPRYDEMKLQFSWLKCPVLLPVAWVCRAFRFLINPNLVKTKKNHLRNDELRQNLMHELEIL